MSGSKNKSGRPLFFIVGNQLFPPSHLDEYRHARFFMAEDHGLCTYVRHHKQKIVLFLAAMRDHADELRKRDFSLDYIRLTDLDADVTYEQKLARAMDEHGCDKLIAFEIEDRFFEKRIRRFADDRGVELTLLPSPMFLTPRDEFADYLDETNKPFMATFYQRQRKRMNLLLDADGGPIGGRWSFDDENRRKLPGDVKIPDRPQMNASDHVCDVCRLVEARFPDHPGSTDDFWWPTTRRQALHWLRAFLDDHFVKFGDYEDALSDRDPLLFHSVLSPTLNMGLVTPDEVLDRALKAADDNDVPLNSLEGFVRQIIGWREFIRGIDHHFGEQQESTNFWNHKRSLTSAWYDGTTGLPPLDDAIRKAVRLGWTHHIERLMILGNVMLLCEVEPKQAYTWFMQMFVDSSDWVMGPNVYGMVLFSDGGVFATKPYICGSNYILKMSDATRGPWCEVMDGLYWRFVDKHRDFFGGNPRLAMMTRTLDKLDVSKKKRIFAAADEFIDKVTDA